MKHIKPLFYCLLLTFSYSLLAQPSLTILGGLIDFPSNITDGQDVIFKCYVKNVGNEDFDGILRLDYTANGEDYSHEDDESIFHDFELVLEAENIMPANDSIRISHIENIHIGVGGFQEGSNIVVLWPSGEVNEDVNTPAANGRISAGVILPAADSLHFQFTMHTAVGINNLDTKIAPRLIYVAAQQQVFVQNNETNNALESVSFFDNWGRQLAKYAAPLQSLDVQTLPAAMYIAEMKMQNGKVYRTKFVKQ